MYTIKKEPEDFIVDEMMELAFDVSGHFSYYSLKKRNYTTSDAVKKIAQTWKIIKLQN